MSNAILAQSITRQNVGNALRLMRHECRYNAAEVTALNKAGLELEASPWQYDGEMLVITSRTTATTRYTVTYSGCSCKAGQNGRPCWHMAAFLLIQRAAQLALTPAKPRMSRCRVRCRCRRLRRSLLGGRHAWLCIIARGAGPDSPVDAPR